MSGAGQTVVVVLGGIKEQEGSGSSRDALAALLNPNFFFCKVKTSLQVKTDALLT